MDAWNKRFFESTRGRVLKLLCGSTRTVTELATYLKLTDNAVRSHLAALERDGLVQQDGVRRGTRKPNFAYALTTAGNNVFPKAHAPVLSNLIDVLTETIDPSTVEQTLLQAGQRLADEYLPGIAARPPAERIQQLLETVAKTGTELEVVNQCNFTAVNGCSCPLSDVVKGHPELCRIAASLLTNLLGVPVTEHCDRAGMARCSFHIQGAEA